MTGESRGQREQVRLAAEKFEQKISVPQIGKVLRFSERPVERWHRDWQAGGLGMMN